MASACAEEATSPMSCFTVQIGKVLSTHGMGSAEALTTRYKHEKLEHKTRKRGDKARARRRAKQAAKRRGMTLKAYLREVPQ